MPDRSISRVSWGRVQSLTERLAGDVQDTFRITEHIDRLGLDEDNKAGFTAMVATIFDWDSNGEQDNPVGYLDSLHTYIGLNHNSLITRLRNWLCSNDARVRSDPETEEGDDAIVARTLWGFATLPDGRRVGMGL